MGNLGPLPTDFTIPANCASELDDIYFFRTSVNQDSPSAYYLLRGPLEQTLCYPGSYSANTEQYYSPARCPTGFTAPCQSINRAGTVEETVLTCCPTQGNYICQTDIEKVWETTQGCRSKITATSFELVLSKVSSGVTSRATATLNTNDAVNAYSIQVRYQSTDFISSSSSSPTPSSAGETQDLTITPINTPTNTSTNTSHSTASNGTIAAIVVGVLAAIIIAVVAVFLLIRRRRRRRSNPQPGNQEQQQQYFGPFKINSDNTPVVQELDAHRAIELDSRMVPPRSGGGVEGLMAKRNAGGTVAPRQ
ncbi:hypothetical protein E0Z10_g7666 [Xylaria hypoxylon]|uniref:Mid2 domain-containing protein n=1 Tax=Xylaria hypoxylon TaxID=37992 RepID=A0A4Z0YPJ7_9PEZI|nr:hypothetical protein E0Z10_g7666 [Xylaria hypoxylon]